jgi:glycerol-3-phosphate dehydrogenase
MNISRLNKKLERTFGGAVHAELRDGCLYLSGELPDWNKVVSAGKMSVNKKKYTVVNDIKFTGGRIPSAKLPAVSSNRLAGARPDALVIGGGVVGCAIARELTRYKLDVMLVEKEHDVALHASGRNDGMISPGLDLRRGQLKKKYTDAGNRIFAFVCKKLDVPFRYTGQYLCFSGGWMKPAAFLSLLYWKLMGIPAEYISRRRLVKREPHLSDKINFAIFFPTAGVVDPLGLTIAYAENAADNGAKICLDTAVIDIDVWNGKVISVLTNHGRIYPKLVINAAGVFAEDIARLARDRFFSIHPKKSANIIFDKKAAFLVNTIASSLHSSQAETAAKARCKCGCLVHTIDGNLLASLNAEETFEKENFSTDKESIRAILSKQRKTAHDLFERDIIACFTGISAATYEEDFIVSFGKYTNNIIHAAGIQSPGLTAAPAIAVNVASMAAKYLGAKINEEFNPARKAIVRAAELSVDERDALIKKEPDYGDIICRCEEISRGEVIAALRRSVLCDTVDGVKLRVRSGMGRCQGSFCSPHVAEIIAEEKKIPVTEVRKMSHSSAVRLGDNKVIV